MKSRLNFGILSTGNIARQFAAGVNGSRQSALAAVASRDHAKAQSFASEYRIPCAYGSYEALLADPTVDAVYVALPNTMHHEWTLKALRAGKHVLCEKPFATNPAQAEEMFDVAAQTGRLLMEAFMYRCHPLTHAVLKSIQSGEIGQVRLIRTSFCYRTNRIQGNIRFMPELAGGAIMDIGCYCISLARLIAGQEPSAIQATAHIHESGVDDLTAGTLRFPNGVIATFTCGMQVQASNAAYICGSEGYIEIPVPWKPPARQAAYAIHRATPPRQDNPNKPATTPPSETRYVDAEVELYGIESDDFASSILGGTPPRISRQETIGNMRVVDEIRRQIGVIR